MLFLKLGFTKSVLFLIVISILLSVLVTGLVTVLLGDGPSRTGFTIAIIVPTIIAPLFGTVYLRLFFKLEAARARAYELAITDVLTGAFNRRHFFELAERELSHALRQRQPLALILFDVDDFKQVNDRFGHQCGDAALQAIGAACRASIRRHDVFGRYGGEEFVLLLPDTELPEAEEVARRLQARIAALANVWAGQSFRVTISLGLAASQGEAASLDALLSRADTALYAAKHAGKNLIQIAEPAGAASLEPALSV